MEQYFGRRKLSRLKTFRSAADAYVYIKELYTSSVTFIQEEFHAYCQGRGVRPERLRQATYPYVGITVNPEDVPNIDSTLSYGMIIDPGSYGATLTRPDLFHTYYHNQLERLLSNHAVDLLVAASDEPIPLPYVMNYSEYSMTEERVHKLSQYFALPNIMETDDLVANGVYTPPPEGVWPLSLFGAQRVDYSLHRLQHYTGTAPECFQRFVLLTNYQRYIGEFIDYAKEKLRADPRFTQLDLPGGVTMRYVGGDFVKEGEDPTHLPQMPAYHLRQDDGNGITFINIGVGPSNAKTITDHLAVLRPHCWIMVGHCAGLRRNQRLGDYVLGHAYVRDDHVLDQDIPIWIPIPPIAEIQVALQKAIADVTGQKGIDIKTRMRTGTVATTDNRNWELHTQDVYHHLRQSRAIAVDMESATIAANGFRFRVPYGTLLCVSDKPIHGELKMPGSAQQFYEQRVVQHLQIGLRAVEILADRGPRWLHSRKLRGFHEVPFR